MPKLRIHLGPVALTRLAGYAEIVDALADQFVVTVRDDNAAPYDAAPDMVPNAKLKRAAARGVALLVASRNAQLTGVAAEQLATRLISLGTSAHVATGVAGQLTASRVLASIELTDAQREHSIGTLIASLGLTTERR